MLYFPTLLAALLLAAAPPAAARGGGRQRTLAAGGDASGARATYYSAADHQLLVSAVEGLWSLHDAASAPSPVFLPVLAEAAAKSAPAQLPGAPPAPESGGADGGGAGANAMRAFGIDSTEPLVFLHSAKDVHLDFVGADKAAPAAHMSEAVDLAHHDAQEAEIVAFLRKQVSALRSALASALAEQVGKALAGRRAAKGARTGLLGGKPLDAAHLLAIDCQAAASPGAAPTVRVGLVPWLGGKVTAADKAAGKAQVNKLNRGNSAMAFKRVSMFALDFGKLLQAGGLAPTATAGGGSGVPLALGGRLACPPAVCAMIARYAQVCAGIPSPVKALKVIKEQGLELDALLKRAQTELRDNLAKKDLLLKDAAKAVKELHKLIETSRIVLQDIKTKARPISSSAAATSHNIGVQPQEHSPHPPLPEPPIQPQSLGGLPWPECSLHGLSYEALCKAIESAANAESNLQAVVDRAKTGTAVRNPSSSADATATTVAAVQAAVNTLHTFVDNAVSEGPPAVALAVPGDPVVAPPPPRKNGGLAQALRKLTKKGRIALAKEGMKDIVNMRAHRGAGTDESMTNIATLRTTFFKGPVTYSNSFFANVWRSSVITLRCVDDPSAVDGRVAISWQEDFSAAPSNSFYLSTLYADPAFTLERCEDVDFSKTPKVKDSASWGARLSRHWVAAPFRMASSAISAVKNFFAGNRKNLPKQLLKASNCVKGRCRCVKLSDPVWTRNDGVMYALGKKWGVKPGDNGETPAGRLSYLRLDLSDTEALAFGRTLNHFSASCTVARRRTACSTQVRSVFGIVDLRFKEVLREMSITPAKLAAAHAALAGIETGLADVRAAFDYLRRTKKKEQSFVSAAKELSSTFSKSISHLTSLLKATVFGHGGFVERSPAYGPDTLRMSAIVSAMGRDRSAEEHWKKAEASSIMFHWAKAAAPEANASGGTRAPTNALPPLLTWAPDDVAKADLAKTVTLWASEPVRPCHEFMQCFPQSYLHRGGKGAFPVWDACGRADGAGATQCLCAVTAVGGDKDDGEARGLNMIAKHVVPWVRRLRVSNTDANILLKEQLAALQALAPTTGFAEGSAADAAGLARQVFSDLFPPLRPKDEGCRAVAAAALDVAYEDESKQGWLHVFSSLFFFQVHVELEPLIVNTLLSDKGAVAARENDFYCVWRSGPQFDALQQQIARSGGLVSAAPAAKIAACNRCPKTDGVVGQGSLPEKVNQQRCMYQAFVTEVLEKGGPVDRSLLRDFLLRNPAGDDERRGEIEEFSGGLLGRKGYAGLPEPKATKVEMETRFTQPCREGTKPLVDLRLPDNECGRIMNSVPGAGGQLAPEKKGLLRRLFGRKEPAAQQQSAPPQANTHIGTTTPNK